MEARKTRECCCFLNEEAIDWRNAVAIHRLKEPIQVINKDTQMLEIRLTSVVIAGGGNEASLPLGMRVRCWIFRRSKGSITARTTFTVLRYQIIT